VSVAFIAGIDSVIGRQLAKDLSDSMWKVLGSSRREEALNNASHLYCDFLSDESVTACIDQLEIQDQQIDLLILCVGVLHPIGLLGNNNFDDWAQGFKVNAINPMRFIHGMISRFLLKENAMVLTFAGGGINSAPTNYSSYTISKVALTKSMEVLASEYPNMKFVSLGTGWINSPIHNQTLAAGVEAGKNLEELKRRIDNQDFQPVESVSDFVFWAHQQDVKAVSGRNFSLVADSWGDLNLVSKLLEDFDKFKLRRFGND
jgi:NAD(P)-dependent dehydrogenase (short-subunit alcohol dehydrogenase family)